MAQSGGGRSFSRDNPSHVHLLHDTKGRRAYQVHGKLVDLVSRLHSGCPDDDQPGQNPESGEKSRGGSVGCRYLCPVSPTWVA